MSDRDPFDFTESKKESGSTKKQIFLGITFFLWFVALGVAVYKWIQYTIIHKRSENTIVFTFLLFWFILVGSIMFLFRQSYLVMILEKNGENIKKYTLPQLIIHRRSQGNLKEKFVTRNKTLSKREVHAISVSEHNRQSVKKTVHKR